MKLNYISKRQKKAFTLIELLIVIAIIGILFVVLISRVDFATDKAKATGVQTDFRAFQVAFEQVSKENAGFATFGWDTGDANGNRIRDSYDQGDTDQDGVEDPNEIWTGRKTYGETWTNVYTLKNPKPGMENDYSAVSALEAAINANLDPKLHITIANPDVNGKYFITMANQARDPWGKEYHGEYLTNAETDKMDRGAILLYSDGANGKNGSEHSIANGVVTVTVPGNNVAGQDDYAIISCYTYVNGYGEVATTTFGFVQNQEFLSNSNNGGNNDITQDDIINAGLINFNVGTFESSTEYTPGVFEEISYEVSKTREKKPVATTSGIILTLAHQSEDLTTMSPSLSYESDYVAYVHARAGDYNETTGLASVHLNYRGIYNLHDDTLENAIYIAAYIQNGSGFKWNVAKWDGSQYVYMDCRSQIDAITDFTETYTETVTETVTISQPAFNTEYVYVPNGTMQAEPGMTWSEWINSSYNVLDFSVTNVWTSDYQEVSLDSLIIAEKSYAFKAGGSAMTMNEYGFYFNQPYQFTMDGITGEYIFYEDGSALLYADSIGFGAAMPAGTLQYSWKSIVSNGVPATVSEDGMSFSESGMTATLSPIEAKPLQYGVVYRDELTGVNSVIFNSNGSVQVTANGESGTLPAGSATFSNGILRVSVDGDNTPVALHPNGRILVLGETVLKLEAPRLPTPFISLSNGTLLISPVNGAASYSIYIEEQLFTTTSSLSVDLSGILNNKDNVAIAVKAISKNINYNDSLVNSIWISSSNKMEPGLYDSNDQLVCSWASLKLDYGLRLEEDYQNFPSESGHPSRVSHSLENILKRGGFATATKLVIGKCEYIGRYSLSHDNCQIKYVVLSSYVTNINDSISVWQDECYLSVDSDNPKYSMQNGCIIDTTTKTLVWGNIGCELPDDGSVTIIGQYALRRSITNSELIIPDGVLVLESRSCYSNQALTTVTLPSSIKKLNGYCFEGCPNITTIIYQGTTTQWKSVSKGYKWIKSGVQIICTDGTLTT